MGITATAGEVVGVFLRFFGEVFLQAGFEGTREGDDPVFRPLSIVDDDGSLAEVDVLDAQAERFHESKT